MYTCKIQMYRWALFEISLTQLQPFSGQWQWWPILWNPIWIAAQTEQLLKAWVKVTTSVSNYQEILCYNMVQRSLLNISPGLHFFGVIYHDIQCNKLWQQEDMQITKNHQNCSCHLQLYNEQHNKSMQHTSWLHVYILL